MPAITSSLASFVSSATWETLPSAVVHEAKRAILNFFGAAIAGSRDPAVDRASKLFQRFSGVPQATVVGRDERLDMLHAAALNAMAANAFDFDDTHLPTIIHPTAPVAPPLMAMAESAPMTGQQFLLAFVLGVDVECRLGNAVHPGHYERGWQITSTCGVFGAAAAATKALGLDATRTGWALGNATVQAAGLVEGLGSMSKILSVGNAARNGLTAALLAELGFSGPLQPLEGPRGFLSVTCDAPVMEPITEDLGKRWELMANTYKPYPCGVVLNPVIEACLALAPSFAGRLGEIAKVEITGHPLLRQRTDRLRPATGREAQVSAQHAVAVTLCRRKATLEDFSDLALSDQALAPVQRKVCFIDNPCYDFDSATVAITLGSGTTLGHHVDHAQGSLAHPLPDSALEQKLRELVRYAGSKCDSGSLINAVWNLESCTDVGAIVRMTALIP